VSADGIAFGNVDGAFSTQASGAIRVTCPSGTPYNVALDAGLNYDVGNFLRRMQNPAGDSIAYALFDDAAGVEWGDSDFANTFPGAPSVAGIGTGVEEGILVTGVTDYIPSPFGSVWTAGTTYSDTVFVTVHF
jgi:spore coat protein U-like protein